MFDQGYYYGMMDRGGLNIHNCSGKQDIMLKNITKRPREFDGSLITEYTEYISSCKCVCYIGAIKIDQGDYNARYDTLYHIFVPSVSNLNEPYDYIRYVLPYYYDFSKSLDAPLNKKEIPPISQEDYRYDKLLSYCGLNAGSDTKKLARLLELAYGVMFNKKAAVILPDEMFDINREPIPTTLGENPENCYQLAAALMLLLHQLVPDCFDSFNSRDRLRITLMYSIVKTTLYKNGFCFISRKDSQNPENIDCPIFDWEFDYNDYPEDNFYYALAEKAQQSLSSVKDFLDKLCVMRGVEKIPCRRQQENVRHLALNDLLSTYRGYVPRLKIARYTESRLLMTWDSYQTFVLEYKEKTGIVFYREYIHNLVECGGRNQIPGDTELQEFWKLLKVENFRDVKAVIFLLGECKSEDIFFSLLKDVLDREDILSELTEDENAVLSEMIKNISESENGIVYLKKITDSFRTIANCAGECFQKIKDRIFSQAKTLYQNSESDEDRQERLDVMQNAGLFDKKLLEDFIYEDIAVSDDIETADTEKNKLNPQKNYDVIKGKKMFSEYFRKCRQLFEEDKKETDIRNKETVNSWKNICSKLEKFVSDEQKSNEFGAFCKEEEKFYRRYAIVNGNSRKEMGDFPEDDIEHRDLYIERLSVIVPNFVDLRANDTNWNNLKDIFDWNAEFGGNLKQCEKYKLFTASMENVYDYFAEAVRKKDYPYLSFSDEVNDDKLKKKVWENVGVQDFSDMTEKKYATKEPYIHARNCLFAFYGNFTDNISEKIVDFSEKFVNYENLEADVLAFMELDKIKQCCRENQTAMKNYYYLSGILDEKKASSVIYNNFGGNIPLCTAIDTRTRNENKIRAEYIKRIGTIADSTEKYRYMKLFSNNWEKEKLSPEKMDISLLDDGEKTQLCQNVEKRLEKNYIHYEDLVFNDDDPNKGLDILAQMPSATAKYKDIIGIDTLKKLVKDSNTRLFNKFMQNLDSNENLDDAKKELYITEANKRAFDEEAKNQLKKYVENDIKSQFICCEEKVLAGNAKEGMDEWYKVVSKSKAFKDIINVDNLKQDSYTRLFDWFMNQIENNENLDENSRNYYISSADSCDVDNERKKRLAAVKKRIAEQKKREEEARKEAKKIRSCTTLSKIKDYLEKKEITFNKIALERTKELLENQKISFIEYKTGISILKTYAGQDKDVQDYIREHNEAIRQSVKKDVLEKKFVNFWFLYADISENVEFLRKLWKDKLTPYDFERINSDVPESYSKIEDDIAVITNDNQYNDINVNLFLVYIAFEGYRKHPETVKNILNDQKTKIKDKCGTCSSQQKENNADRLKQALLVILEKFADSIIPEQPKSWQKQSQKIDDFLFGSWFKLADIYLDAVYFENSNYFHVEIAEKLEETSEKAKSFLTDLAHDFARKTLKDKYKNLNVLKFTLKCILVDWYMEQFPIDPSFEMAAKRKIVFEAYDNDIIRFEKKLALKEHWKALVENEEKGKKLSSNSTKAGIIKEIKKRIETGTSTGNRNIQENEPAVESVEPSVQNSLIPQPKGPDLVSDFVKQSGVFIVPKIGEQL